jgi:sporulation protein YlmC with PRC-barrel domain
MLKQTLTVAALAAALATPAFAQSPTNNNAQSSPAQMNTTQKTTPSMNTTAMNTTQSFVQQQQATDWRSSKLVGTSVYGTGNAKIGSIDDVLIGSDGNVKAVVVGVGGFLGVGEKDVAIPFNALNVERKSDSSSINKITVSYSKDDLKNAPKFAYYQAAGTQTTGSGINSSTTNTPMKK